jgi:response regulator RpfG family c-di-GMP phosphodiesterase
MDIQMPEMDGIETTGHLRKLSSNLPPIIAMTAYAMKEDRDRFMANGMNDYVPKPIRAEILVRKVAEWTQRQSLEYSKTTNWEQPAVTDNQEDKVVNNKPSASNNPTVSTIEQHTLELDKFEILDQEIIKQLADSVGGDMSFVASILEGFEEEATEQIQNAIEGHQANNCKQVQAELHTLKGNSGTLGAMRLHEITRIIEEKAKHCDFQLFDTEIVILQDEFNKFKKEIIKMKSSV